ncbi:MAG: imidazole glycerol phosphate synthase subunit HisH [Spirochaetaceae bacterium]|nr:MAG: imidazole glycerol phosphate synthase subunit HisH [Spirochaetaceae bacterium]
MRIGIVDYDAGNLTSVETALRRIDADFFTTDDPDAIFDADRIVFPGVGEARAAMEVLNTRGLSDALRRYVDSGRLILGICVGAQVILEASDERDVSCLALIPGRARRFPVSELKVPQIGWNGVDHENQALFAGVPSGGEFYFVHSYYPAPTDERHTIGWTEYGVRFASALRRDNVYAVQFHPEKSGPFGLRVLTNFVTMKEQ